MSGATPRVRKRGRGRWSAAFATVLAAGLVVLPAGQQASATSPGVNGLIYFEQSGHIWSLSPTGEKKKVVPKKKFAYLDEAVPSPDGTMIAFSYGGGSDIWTKNLTTGAYRNVTGRAGDAKSLTFIEAPAWSPDSKQLVFEADRGGYTKLYRINADGTKLKQLQAFPAFLAGDISPDWSSTGKIVFCYEGSLWTIQPDGSGLTEVASPDEFESRGFYRPSWSPDGTQIAAEVDGTSFADGGIVLVNPSAAVGLPKYDYLTGDADVQHSELIEDPAWSPDGTKIVYYGHWSPEDADLERQDLWTVDVANPDAPPVDLNARDELGQHVFYPNWAPAPS
jgi:Tol biopolymer transport system component